MRHLIPLLVLLAACGEKPVPGDPPTSVTDSGIVDPDGGSVILHGSGVPDSGLPDAGTPDAGTPDAGPHGGGDWTQYRGGPRGTWSNPGTFTAAQAQQTSPAWTFDAGSYGFTEPLIVGDTVFIT